MSRLRHPLPPALEQWLRTVLPRTLPFADAASQELPLGRLLRLSLFQVSVGMAGALLVGTLNRVMIVELGMSAWLVALMVSLPILAAPFRTLIGYRSDVHRSAIGWRRVPYLWMGTFLLFAGFSIMPFALMVLTGEGELGLAWVGQIAAALSFLLVGLGMQTTQTAGLALATDIAPEAARPRVVAMLYVLLLLGMVGGGLIFSAALEDFSGTKLIQLVQGVAVLTVLLNVTASWKQEARDPNRRHRLAQESPLPFRALWQQFIQRPASRRFLWTVGLGTAAFNMQEIVLEPYGGEILNLSVGQTSALTALLAGGSLAAFAWSARCLAQGHNALRIAGLGLLIGLPGFSLVLFAAPADSALMFRIGTVLVGFGAGLFAVSTLTAAMDLEVREHAGFALGAWGAVQATAAGVAVGLGGTVRDAAAALAADGSFGPALQHPATGYGTVYAIELFLLFLALIALGPLVRLRTRSTEPTRAGKFGLADFPG
jgi:BCD family chlorophyll transporter-like MFS transporter